MSRLVSVGWVMLGAVSLQVIAVPILVAFLALQGGFDNVQWLAVVATTLVLLGTVVLLVTVAVWKAMGGPEATSGRPDRAVSVRPRRLVAWSVTVVTLVALAALWQGVYHAVPAFELGADPARAVAVGGETRSCDRCDPSYYARFDTPEGIEEARLVRARGPVSTGSPIRYDAQDPSRAMRAGDWTTGHFGLAFWFGVWGLVASIAVPVVGTVRGRRRGRRLRDVRPVHHISTIVYVPPPRRRTIGHWRVRFDDGLAVTYSDNAPFRAAMEGRWPEGAQPPDVRLAR